MTTHTRRPSILDRSAASLLMKTAGGAMRQLRSSWAAVALGAMALGGASPDAEAGTLTIDFSTGNNAGFTTSAVSGPVWNFGSGISWRVPYQVNTNSSLFSTTQTSTGGAATITFVHNMVVENGWDGGQVNAQINGGAFNKVGAAAFTAGGYNSNSNLTQNAAGIVAPNYSGSVGTLTSTFSLGALNAGDTVSLQWLFGTDNSVNGGNAAAQWSIFSVIFDGFIAPALTGPVLQNAAPVSTPTTGNFLVNGQVATAGGNNTINSLIFGPGSTLQVNNTLFVTGGPVNLGNNSTINLNGFLSASLLNTFFGSTLNGNGGIIGNLINNGLVSPGNSPGVIRVSGNYRQSRTGTLRIEVGGTSEADYDRLIVGGTADLDGRLELVRLNNFKLKRGNKIVFLTAAQGVNGEFAEVSNPFTSETILEPTVVYGDTEVSLELVRGSFADLASDYGLTPNQRAVARALDSVSAEDADNKALVYLDERHLSKLPGDFDKIAPEELTSIFTISTSLATVQNTNLQRRTDDIRHGASGFSASGLAMQGTGPGYSGSLAGVAGPTGKETKDVVAPTPEEKKWGVFLTGVGEWVDVGGDGNARGYDITTGGFTLGLDYKVCPNFVVGIAAGYAGTGADLNNGGDVWVNGGKLGLYASVFSSPSGGAAGPTGKEVKEVQEEMTPVGPSSQWYLDLAVNGGYNSYDTKRSALQGAARGSTDGGELNVLVGAGYDWKIGALTIGPTATYQYSLVGIDGFTETGSLAPLNINDRNAESIRTTLGFKASYDWKVGGVLVRPEIRAAWQHEFGDSSYGLDASFANGAGNGFLVNGPEIGRDSLLLGAGVAIQCSERFSTYFYYDGEIGRENYDRHGVSGGVRMAF